MYHQCTKITSCFTYSNSINCLNLPVCRVVFLSVKYLLAPVFLIVHGSFFFIRSHWILQLFYSICHLFFIFSPFLLVDFKQSHQTWYFYAFLFTFYFMVMEWISVWNESILIWDDLNATFESFMVKSQEAEPHGKVCVRAHACLPVSDLL